MDRSKPGGKSDGIIIISSLQLVGIDVYIFVAYHPGKLFPVNSAQISYVSDCKAVLEQ
jgi:hypothetical protein